jgi:hypothetical protein
LQSAVHAYILCCIAKIQVLFYSEPPRGTPKKGNPKEEQKKEPFSGSPKRNAKVEDDLTSLSFRPLKRNSNEEVPQRGTLKQEPFSGTLY